MIIRRRHTVERSREILPAVLRFTRDEVFPAEAVTIADLEFPARGWGDRLPRPSFVGPCHWISLAGVTDGMTATFPTRQRIQVTFHVRLTRVAISRAG
ncbi:hypothetical protein [Nonomuraea sp. NPDC050783]|uniref:hypothetical protein n=1 Tax=Nonomuraea sp. NPDC050783 TaxID=3154634 RepID=UPI003466250E